MSSTESFAACLFFHRAIRSTHALANLFSAISIAGVLIIAGCSKPPYDVAPVRGKVTIDGKPLARGKIIFAPVAKGGSINAGKPATAMLQADGSFALSTYGHEDGAVVGEHYVTVVEDDDPSSTSATGRASTVPKFSRVAVPKKQTVVSHQDNQIDIALTGKSIARAASVRSD